MQTYLTRHRAPLAVLRIVVAATCALLPATAYAGPRFTEATPAAVCGECHQDKHSQWLKGSGEMPTTLELVTGETVEGTAHAYAWLDELFRVEYQHTGEPAACLRCHMPSTVYSAERERGIYAPVARPLTSQNYEEGVTCVSCHLGPDGFIRGPGRLVEEGSQARRRHAVIVDPGMREASFCAGCHDDTVGGALSRTYSEWKSWSQTASFEGQACQSCHMQKAEHTWPGGHSLGMPARAMDLDLVGSLGAGEPLVVKVVNLGAGHNLPSGENLRGFVMEVEVLDARGAVVLADSAVVAHQIRTPTYYAQEARRRIDPVPPEDARDWLLGELPAGEYTVRVEVVYQLEREATLVYLSGDTRYIHATGEQPVGTWSWQLHVR